MIKKVNGLLKRNIEEIRNGNDEWYLEDPFLRMLDWEIPPRKWVGKGAKLKPLPDLPFDGKLYPQYGPLAVLSKAHVVSCCIRRRIRLRWLVGNLCA